jgi:hypothetical protein
MQNNNNDEKKPEFPPTNSAGRELMGELNDLLGPEGKKAVNEWIWARTGESRMRRSEMEMIEEVRRASQQDKD